MSVLPQRGECIVKLYRAKNWGVLRGDAYIMGGRVLCQSMCPPIRARAGARARARTRSHARTHAHVGPADLTPWPASVSLDLSTADPAEDRARRVTVQPAPLFNNLARDGVANGC